MQNVYDHSELAADLEPLDVVGGHRPAAAEETEEAEGTPAAFGQAPSPVALAAAERARGPAAALVCFLAGDAAMLYAGASQAACTRSSNRDPNPTSSPSPHRRRLCTRPSCVR